MALVVSIGPGPLLPELPGQGIAQAAVAARATTKKAAVKKSAWKAKKSTKAGKVAVKAAKSKPDEATRTIEAAMQATANIRPLADAPDLLRQVPFEVASLAPDLPERFEQADVVMRTLEQAPQLLVHMEVLRRAQASLPESQKKQLLVALLKRYQAKPTVAATYFDHGYAQLVFLRNKTGLFFLRKANDDLKTQESSFAYALAQADIELHVEQVPGETYTTRKMDVGYKVQDAVERDVQKHQPGFWPSLSRFLDALKPLAAYRDVLSKDYAAYYVPAGNRTLPFRTLPPTLLAPEKTSHGQPPELAPHRSEGPPVPPMASVSVGGGTAATSAAGLMLLAATAPPTLHRSHSQTPPLKDATPYALGLLGPTSTQIVWVRPNHGGDAKRGTYRLVITNDKGARLAELDTPVAPYVFEDLDHDDVFEVVLRYGDNRRMPVQVYRYRQGRYVLDTQLARVFQ
jgi:hypothetical protein